VAGELDGVRVLDFSRYVAGPYGGMILADLGAEVIRVEPPGGSEDRSLGPFLPDGESIPYGLILARNKKSITLDLGRQRGREILDLLISKGDILIHNFPPSSMEASLLDYGRLEKINPGIVVVWISGFGPQGPRSSEPCFDSIAQALSGAMSYCGFPGNPPTRSAVPYVDLASGVFAALGAMVALRHRERTGKGQLVDVALLDTALSFVAAMGVFAEWEVLGFEREAIGNYSFHTYANAFQVKDGWVMVNVIGNGCWRRFTKAVGMEDVASDPRFSDDETRFRNRELITAIVAQWMAQRSAQEVLEVLKGARVPCAQVMRVSQVMRDPHLRERKTIAEVEHGRWGKVPVPGPIPRFSRIQERRANPGPSPGQHNREIYGEVLGLSAEEMEVLRREGVI